MLNAYLSTFTLLKEHSFILHLQTANILDLKRAVDFYSQFKSKIKKAHAFTVDMVYTQYNIFCIYKMMQNNKNNTVHISVIHTSQIGI